MSRVLGLDLGTNSIGWALIDETKNQIIGMGSRIFPAGVNDLGQGKKEVSKNAGRTDARGKRRQFFRQRLRKRFILKILSENGLCPIPPEDLKPWDAKTVFPKLIGWFKLNPYELREKATHSQISLEELGRVFYHMIQRRGFQSNSRSAGKEDGTIYDGKPKEGKIGINDTRNSIANKTLGSYLYEISPKENEAYIENLERIRNRYTTRQMYIDEFEEIWEVQKEFHKKLNKELKTKIGGRKKEGYDHDGVLFHQRPLRSQKHLVGNCTLEPKKTKTPISTIIFEEFKIYQWVNTVECNERKLSSEDRELLAQELLIKPKPKFKALRKVIDKLDSGYRFNYKDDDKISGSHTISSLSNKKFFGKKWFNFSNQEKENIWHTLYDFEDISNLKEYAIKKWGFDNEKAELIAKFNLKDGYSSLSKKAINNILPFLKLGYTYDIAVVLGGIKNAFGKQWSSLIKEEKDLILDNIYDIVREGRKGGFIKGLKEFLVLEYNLTHKDLEKLYHHSANIGTSELLNKLPLGKNADKEIQSIKNPIVITALFEIRKLVNEIIQNYGKPDKIKIELARDLKISKTKRSDIRSEQKRLEKKNDKIKEELDKLNQRHTHDNILLYNLWGECNRTCPYTNKPITVKQLFTGEVQIEHIIPWSKSLNDSFMNKTLCFADENRAKGNQTPYEFYKKQGDEKWEAVKLQALSCFKNKTDYPNAYAKFKQFIKAKYDDDFTSRQLNDTRYISKKAKEYLSQLVGENSIDVSPGQATAKLRHHWGLNSILNDENKKSRDDHRHHAIDALVVACTSRSHLQELSKWNRYDRNVALKNFPMPWSTFFEDANNTTQKILVSHKISNNVLTTRLVTVEKNGETYTNQSIAARGQLHKETVYGKRTAPNSEEAYHVRKVLTALTEAEIPKIVDDRIRALVYERIKDNGLEKDPKNNKVLTKEKKDKDVFKIIFNEPLYLPNKNGNPVPIKKVRLKKDFGNAEPLKGKEINQWVDLRNNHHVLIYKDEEGKLKEDVVTFWTAVERKRQGQNLIQLPPKDSNGTIITTLQINDMFLLGLNEKDLDWDNLNYTKIHQHLYRVQKFTAGDYYFRKHIESSLDGKLGVSYQYIKGFGTGKTGWKTFNPIKVQVSVSGKIKIKQ